MSQLPLTAEQQAEVDRRIASLDDDRRDGIRWSALKIEVEQRCVAYKYVHPERPIGEHTDAHR